MLIYRYNFNPSQRITEIELPAGADIFYAFGNKIWAKVNPTQSLEKRKIFSLATGENCDDVLVAKHIGTIKIPANICDDCRPIRHIFVETTDQVFQLTPELKQWIETKIDQELIKRNTAGWC